MNNFIMGFKKFITNKNVVTVIGVIVVLGILFWGYTSSIKKETNPLRLPVAAKKINAKTQITNEDVFMLKYAIRFDEKNNPTFIYYRERICKNNGKTFRCKLFLQWKQNV